MSFTITKKSKRPYPKTNKAAQTYMIKTLKHH